MPVMIGYLFALTIVLAPISAVSAEQSGQTEERKSAASSDCPQNDPICIGANNPMPPPALKSEAGGVKTYGGGGGAGGRGILMDKLKGY